ncbi:MAG: hypothetical protein RDU14_17005 [Melioribacteraceae bacterium]|nr:hypothetical protein [Melioribacteraceae bacterium]
MAKRFTDTNKWNKVWFRKLSPVHKCFWNYLTDNCNHAGIWDVDLETAKYFIGKELNLETVKEIFSKQIIELDGGKRWFLIDFIEFQYNCDINSLNPSNNVHKSIIQILKKYDIYTLLQGATEGLLSPLQGAKDKDKEQAIDMDKDKENLKERILKNPAELFIRYFPRQGTHQETEDAKSMIKDFGIEIVLYAFHEANKHSAFSTAYVQKVCAGKKAKNLSVMVETRGTELKDSERKEMQDLIKKQKEADKKFNNEILERYTKIKPTLKTIKQQEIQKAINEGIWLRADRLIYEIESREKINPSAVEIPGMQTIGDSINKIIHQEEAVQK